jgi:glycosyltransferase involved in cell wall biosynthesis
VRILVISNLFPPVVHGGYEMICADAVRALRERHEVLVLTSNSGEAVPPESGVLRELDLLAPGKAGTLRAPLASVRAARTMRRLLASFRPELVFVWNAAHIPHAALRIAETSGVPVAYSLAEHWFGGLYRSDQFMRTLQPGQRGLRGLWARFARLANRHPLLRLELERRVPVSIMWISSALEREVPMPATAAPLVERVVYPAPPDPDLIASVERRAPTDPPTVAFLGRLERQKGPSVAYHAVAALRDRHGIDVQLKLAGRATPEKLRQLELLAQELGIEERVHLLGQLDRQRVGDLLAEASALVVPSTWEEPFGLVLIEAALARLPVVGSRSGGMPEALHEGDHALFFPIGDAGACASALARVITNAEETAARTLRAYEHAKTFTPARYAAELESFIDAAVAAHEQREVSDPPITRKGVPGAYERAPSSPSTGT